MTRDEAYLILTKYLTNVNLIKHSLAAEAAMKGIYKYLYKDASYDAAEEEKWGITGLLHDADYELAKGHPEVHGLLLFEKEDTPFPEDIKHAIKSHNYQYTKVLPKSAMDWAIACCDQLTGLIVATALISPARNASAPARLDSQSVSGRSVAGGPDKKLASITADFVLKRFSEKSFAKGADRESIKNCEQHLGITLGDFVQITLSAMQEIGDSLGL